jgi:hypothetical protein
MATGIDQEIQRKVDAYRSNPQQLMQRYQQNQQLVDLLALQKLKSEKEAAARDMQMKMQQTPQTIKQQREAELLNMTKQEMMQQTKGIMDQRQAQQQKNIQQVAQQGLGALSNQRPAAPQPAPQGQPMPKMAGGGIVAFQPGGSVGGMAGLGGDQTLQDQINRIRRRTDLNEGQKQILIRQIRAQQPPERPERDYTIPVGRASSARMPGVQGNIPVGSETSTLDVLAETRPQIAPMRMEPEPDMSGFGMGPTQRLGPRGERAGIAALAEDTAPATPTAGPDDGLRGGPAPESTTPESAQGIAAAATAAGIPAQPSVGGGLGGAEAAMQRGFGIADAYTGRAEKTARFDEMEAERRDLYESQNDPTRNRREQLKAFLLGAANTTNFGSTMASAGAASFNLRQRQQQRQNEQLKEIHDLAMKGMELDTTLAAGGLRLGQAMYEQTAATARAQMSAMASMRNADLRAVMDRAKLQLDAYKEDNLQAWRRDQAEIDRAKLAVDQATNAETNATRRFSAAMTALNNLNDMERRFYEGALANSGIDVMQMQLSSARNEEERNRIQAQINQARNEALLTAGAMMDGAVAEGGISAKDLQQQLMMGVVEFTNIGGGGYATEDLADLQTE